YLIRIVTTKNTLINDASNSALRAVLGQLVGKHFHIIAYASRTLDLAQTNYTTTEKELLSIVFALDKFCSYLLASKIVIFFDHVALKFLLKKPDAKPRLIWWMLLLQEFDIEIRNTKGAKNLVADHLSRIERRIDPLPVRDDFPDEQLLLQLEGIESWFADICNFLVASTLLPEASKSYKEKIKSDAKYYVWDDLYLWRFCSDQIIHRHLEAAITDPIRQLGKYWSMGFIGLPSSRMPITLSPPTSNTLTTHSFLHNL
ncbi:Retrovirus-related Pol polyprotein from transposon 17.6, partial [Mucuna pruriens]